MGVARTSGQGVLVITNDYAHEYTLGLALFDFIPLVVSSIGFLLLASWMQGGFSLAKPAWLGAVMTVTGGTSKALWKFTVVTTGVDVWFLEAAFFPLLAGGFVVLASAFLLLKFERDRLALPAALGLLAGCFGWATYQALTKGEASWSFVMLMMTIAGSSTLYLSMAGVAAARKQFISSLLIILSLGGAFYLTRLARIPEQTLGVQWTAQIVNAFAQLAFMLGVVLLIRLTFKPTAQ